MKYQKMMNIWEMAPKEIKLLQPGQMVYAGNSEQSSRGRFLGVRASGVVVVAWHDNTKGSSLGVKRYLRTMRDYAKNDTPVVNT